MHDLYDGLTSHIISTNFPLNLKNIHLFFGSSGCRNAPGTSHVATSRFLYALITYIANNLSNVVVGDATLSSSFKY